MKKANKNRGPEVFNPTPMEDLFEYLGEIFNPENQYKEIERPFIDWNELNADATTGTSKEEDYGDEFIKQIDE